MKTSALTPALLSVLAGFMLLIAGAGQVWAQTIFRCHSSNSGVPEYINNPKDAQLRECKAVSGGNVTVVQGTAVQTMATTQPSPSVKVPVSASPGKRSESSTEQRTRDSDARTILESELKKSEARLAEQQKEFNSGEPEKQGIEGRNHQRYLDRVAEMKDAIARSQSDVAGLKRELSRVPVAAN
jgi:hypothetical protein